MKPILDIYDISWKLAIALDNEDWSIVKACFNTLITHKKELQEYKGKRRKQQ